MRYLCFECNFECELVDGKLAHPPNGCAGERRPEIFYVNDDKRVVKKPRLEPVQVAF